MKRVLSARRQTRQQLTDSTKLTIRVKQLKENSSSLALMLICSKQLSQTLINDIMRWARDINTHRERERWDMDCIWRPWDAHNEFFSDLQSLSLFSSSQKRFHLCATQLCVLSSGHVTKDNHCYTDTEALDILLLNNSRQFNHYHNRERRGERESLFIYYVYFVIFYFFSFTLHLILISLYCLYYCMSFVKCSILWQ